MPSPRKELALSLVWSSGGHMIVMAITLCTNILLARVLSPHEFGQVGIIMFFIVLANVLVRGGLAGALIRMPIVRRIDYSTVFFFNLIVSLLCYLALVVFSDHIGQFYHDSQLGNLLIVIGLVLIINSFQLVQMAKLMREMRFKQRSLYQLVSTICASIFALVAAYFFEIGVWAIVVLQLTAAAILTMLLWIYEGVYFRFEFSKKSFGKLYAFGINTTVASLISTGFDNVYNLILGKYFIVSQSGFFYQAKKLQDVPNNVINMLSQSVVFSSLSKVQEDIDVFNNLYNRIMTIFSSFVGMFVVMIYLYGEQFILLLYGQEWIGAVFYLKLLSIASFFLMQENFNRVIFKVFNRTRQLLILEIIKKSIQAISLVIGVAQRNLEILMWGLVLTNILSYLISISVSRMIVNSNVFSEIKTGISIILIGILTISLGTLTAALFDMKGYEVLFLLPLNLAVYFTGLYALKVGNVIRDLKTLRNLIVQKA